MATSSAFVYPINLLNSIELFIFTPPLLYLIDVGICYDFRNALLLSLDLCFVIIGVVLFCGDPDGIGDICGIVEDT